MLCACAAQFVQCGGEFRYEIVGTVAGLQLVYALGNQFGKPGICVRRNQLVAAKCLHLVHAQRIGGVYVLDYIVKCAYARVT